MSNKPDLQAIPGVGRSIASDLQSLGIYHPSDLVGKNPEALYFELEERVGQHIDRCVLYVFRCAVYFATTKNPESEKLKWWNWKDAPPSCSEEATSNLFVSTSGRAKVQEKARQRKCFGYHH